MVRKGVAAHGLWQGGSGVPQAWHGLEIVIAGAGFAIRGVLKVEGRVSFAGGGVQFAEGGVSGSISKLPLVFSGEEIAISKA